MYEVRFYFFFKGAMQWKEYGNFSLRIYIYIYVYTYLNKAVLLLESQAARQRLAVLMATKSNEKNIFAVLCE